MKKIVAATLLLLSSVGVSAQTERQPGSIITYDTIPAPPDTLAINAARKGAYLILDVGGGLNNIAFGVPDTCGTKSLGMGITARLGYRYFFTPNWGFGFGAYFSTFQSKAKFNYIQAVQKGIDQQALVEHPERDYRTEFNGLEEKTSLSVIDIPIGLYYQHSMGNRWRFGAGVSFNITEVISQKFKTVSGEIINSGYFDWYQLQVDHLKEYGYDAFSDFSGTPDLKTTIMGVGGEISLHYALTSKLDLTLNLNGAYRLGEIQNQKQDKLYDENKNQYVGITQTSLCDNPKLVNGGATIGICYRFGKKPQPQIIERILPPPPDTTTVAVADTTDDTYNRNADDFGVNIVPLGYTFVNSGLDMTKQLEKKKIGQPIGTPILFALNSDQLADTSHTLMDTVITFLQKNPDVLKIEVSAHTDNVGSDAYNLDLSKRRAQTVVQYIINHGNIAPERLVPMGYGESRPLNDNSTEQKRDINRRVEFMILELEE